MQGKKGTQKLFKVHNSYFTTINAFWDYQLFLTTRKSVILTLWTPLQVKITATSRKLQKHQPPIQVGEAKEKSPYRNKKQLKTYSPCEESRALDSLTAVFSLSEEPDWYFPSLNLVEPFWRLPFLADRLSAINTPSSGLSLFDNPE